MAFESILGKNGNSGMISGSSGSFDFDVVTVESHESILVKTKNPIEKGSQISDHAYLEPNLVTITGTMVGYNVPPKLTVNSFGFDLPDFPLPFDVLQITDQALNVANDFIGMGLSGSTGIAIDIAADFLPSFQVPFADLSGGDRIKNAFENLRALQRSGSLVSIFTHSRLYENMMILSIVLDQDKEFSGEFTLTAEETFIVESKIGSGLSVPGSNMPKQTSKGNAGNTQPKQASVISALGS